MDIKATVAHAKLDRYRRAIVVSDLHGDNRGFSAILRQTGFGEQDALVIVGDILEKGEESLELLRSVMRCAEKGNVYMTAGNNDTIFSEWYGGWVTDEEVLSYMKSHENITLREMARELGMKWDTLDEVRALKTAVRERYAAEIAFLDSLPHILETEHFIFVHAGLKPGPLTEQDMEYCLTVKEFGVQPHRFEKPVIVGHWPASNYCKTIVNVNPYFNRGTNVISIDGGNSLKRWHQINYLILRGETMETGAYDDMPLLCALEDQEASENPLTLEFPRTMVEVLRDDGAESVCFVPALGREMTFADGQLYSYKGKRYCFNMTDYRLPVRSGEILSCCDVEPQGILAKKDGIVGYYTGRYEFLQNPLKKDCIPPLPAVR